MEKKSNEISNGASDLVKEVLEKIKEKHIKPKPKWEFILEEYIIWIFAGASFLVGSLAVAVIIHMVRNNDWDLHDRVSGNLVSFIFATLPYFWLLILSAFIALAYYNFKHTKSGYRFSLRLLVISSILASVFLGVFFYSVGFGWTIDRMFSVRLPFYDRLIFHRRLIWDNPERGMMAGRIISDLGEGNFKLRDLDNKIWMMHGQISSTTPWPSAGQEIIKIIGEPMDNFNFQVRELRSWPGCGWPAPVNCPMLFP
ncbi:MAG: DUF4149 domain-containing protein [Patescibacteria group bacterium]|nr:DUF4149 domain-containing protein [Patescibacteria group bacterium]